MEQVRRVFILLVLLCVGATAFAQNVSLSMGSGSSAAGGTVTVPLSLTSSGGAQPMGLQWSFSFSGDVLGVSVSAGTSATNAQKSIACSGKTCIVYGMNNTVIADGTVAVATFQLAANPSNATIPIQDTSVIGVNAAASSISASGGTASIVLNTLPPPTVTLNRKHQSDRHRHRCA
jgi:Cohesin domain